MSQKQIESVTNSAIKLWSESESPLSYTDFVRGRKLRGELWGAKEVL